MSAHGPGRGEEGGITKGPYLHHAADDLGQHVQGEPENVEERERHEGLLGVEDVVLVHRHVHGECGQRHLSGRIWAEHFVGERHLGHFDTENTTMVTDVKKTLKNVQAK